MLAALVITGRWWNTKAIYEFQTELRETVDRSPFYRQKQQQENNCQTKVQFCLEALYMWGSF